LLATFASFSESSAVESAAARGAEPHSIRLTTTFVGLSYVIHGNIPCHEMPGRRFRGNSPFKRYSCCHKYPWIDTHPTTQPEAGWTTPESQPASCTPLHRRAGILRQGADAP